MGHNEDGQHWSMVLPLLLLPVGADLLTILGVQADILLPSDCSGVPPPAVLSQCLPSKGIL